MLEVYSPELEDVGGALSFVIRATGDPAGIISAVRGVVTEVEPNQAIHNVITMEQRLANATTSRRLNTVLLGSFAGLALLLAVVGIYGVMSYAVTQRTREIGVRIALGASSKEIIRLIVGQGALLVGIGVVIGLGAAALGTRLLAKLLFGVSALDPVTFVGVTALLAATAFLACYVPARRATKVDPMVALREE
jgi:putative ABC transport system permease protein